MKKLLIICGATATGKTSLSIDCAKKLNTEIISADSQLVYKYLNVGTAKPTFDEMRGVRHHLIDVVDPKNNFSVADYKAAAIKIIERLLSEDKTPVICGGTGFYINSILYNLSYGGTAANLQLREKYEKLLEEKGKTYLYEILKEADPITAEKLHENDIKRVIRALEIYESGTRKSEITDDKKPNYDYLAVAVNYPRELLYERINARVDAMFDNGLVEEVKNLLNKGIDENCQCMQAIGYKEVVKCLKDGNKQSTMRDIIKQNTRHYAKRQITFFKKFENLVWLDYDKATAQKVTELLNG